MTATIIKKIGILFKESKNELQQGKIEDRKKEEKEEDTQKEIQRDKVLIKVFRANSIQNDRLHKYDIFEIPVLRSTTVLSAHIRDLVTDFTQFFSHHKDMQPYFPNEHVEEREKVSTTATTIDEPINLSEYKGLLTLINLPSSLIVLNADYVILPARPWLWIQNFLVLKL